jgi:hypothetical protein
MGAAVGLGALGRWTGGNSVERHSIENADKFLRKPDKKAGADHDRREAFMNQGPPPAR